MVTPSVRSRSSPIDGAASSTCSTLSITSSVVGASGKPLDDLLDPSRPGSSWTPSAAAIAPGTRSTLRQPGQVDEVGDPGNASRSPAATSSASRVFPTPPGPVSVVKRASSSDARTAAASSTRPTSRVAGRGRLDAWSERSGGKSVASPSAWSWNRRTGTSMSLSRWSPRSTRTASGPRRSRVDRETTIWPPCPAAAILAASWTSRPTYPSRAARARRCAVPCALGWARRRATTPGRARAAPPQRRSPHRLRSGTRRRRRPLCVDLGSLVPSHGLTEHAPVRFERIAVVRAERPQQLRRAFHVGEEQRDRAGRESACRCRPSRRRLQRFEGSIEVDPNALQIRRSRSGWCGIDHSLGTGCSPWMVQRPAHRAQASPDRDAVAVLALSAATASWSAA